MSLALVRHFLRVGVCTWESSMRQKHCDSMSADDLGHCFELITVLVQKASQLITDASKEKREFTTKSSAVDLLTKTDKEVEQLIVEGILKHYPDHKIIAEETTADSAEAQRLTAAPTWIIDPIDGTMNFVHGFPYYCISVGLWLNRTPVIGIIYNPVLKMRYFARRGEGAFLNDDPIRVSGQKELNKSLVMHELGSDLMRKSPTLANIDNVLVKAHAMRSTGSVALNMCLVAQGASDAFYEFGAHAWDMAAGTLIVREAGGVVIDPCGGELDIMSRRLLVAATQELADELIERLLQMYPRPRDDEATKRAK